VDAIGVKMRDTGKATGFFPDFVSFVGFDRFVPKGGRSFSQQA
jgi:hypothetical protein